MGKVILLCGVSGSGKSTYSINYMKKDLSYLRINRDSIRLNLVGDFSGYYKRKDLNKVENMINSIERDLFLELCLNDKNIIIDSTLLKQEYIKGWISMSKFHNYEYKFKLFDCDLEEAKNRVWYRDVHDKTDDDFTWSIEYEKEKHHVQYIEKQFNDYKLIKEFIQKNYAEYILM